MFINIFASSEPKKVKNISRTSLGDKLGRIHMKPQHLDKMGGRRVGALRVRKEKSGKTDKSGSNSNSNSNSNSVTSEKKRKNPNVESSGAKKSRAE